MKKEKKKKKYKVDNYKSKEENTEKIDVKKALHNRLNRYSPNVEIKSYELAKLDYIEDTNNI